jgi:diketogulonate reductase-like aldo/keto reductase
MKQITLKNGKTIPALGFGTWEIKGDDCVTAVDTALAVGYRHIDTADGYHNHKEVGQGIKQNGIAREDFFLTTKIFPGDLTADVVLQKIDTYLEELGTDYIDLLLIHFPDHSVPLAETLGAMNEAVTAGKVRSLGVSNFTEHHLEDAMETGVEIVLNQVELHPGFPQHEMRAFCAKHDIAVTAYSPLGRGSALEIDLIKELAEKYDKTPGQIILNWLLSVDLIAIPKSTHPERIKENFESQDFTMEPADIEAINALKNGKRLIDPDFAHFDY